MGADFDWFSSRPLAGCGVLVTRTAEQSDELLDTLRELGAEAYLQPVLEIAPPASQESLEKAVKGIAEGKFAGVTFSSTNGVDGLMAAVGASGMDARIFGGCCIAAVGKHTAKRLENFGLRADVCPEVFSAAGLLETLPRELKGQNWLVTATNRSRDELPKGLEQRGASVTRVITYETQAVTKLKPGIESSLRSGRIQWVTITSSAIAEIAAELLAPFTAQLKPISLSRAVSDTLERVGWRAAAQADEHTTDSLVAALVAAVHGDAR